MKESNGLNASQEDEEKDSRPRTASASDNRNSEKIRVTSTAKGYLDDFVIVDKRTLSKNHQSSALVYTADDLRSQHSSIDRDDFNLLRRSSRNDQLEYSEPGQVRVQGLVNTSGEIWCTLFENAYIECKETPTRDNPFGFAAYKSTLETILIPMKEKNK